MKGIGTMLGLMAESISFAIYSLKSERLRTFLSFFGVSIGIFSIVTVLCAVDSLEKNILEGIRSFGSDAMFISTFPMMGDGMETGDDGKPLEWWDYMLRPKLTEEQFEYVASNLSLPGSIVYSIMQGGQVSAGRRKVDGATILMTTEGVENVMSMEIADGRHISPLEFRNGINVAVIGDAVAADLFPGKSPLGERVKVYGRNAVVVGVMKKQGESMASMVETDNSAVIPLLYGKQISKGQGAIPMIMAAAGEGVDKQAFKDEIRMLFRSCRRLSPDRKDNFSISEMTFLLDMFDDIMGKFSLAGWIIGAFSLVIGGFGIANIMFVSVRERMPQIGIQKALGAKRYVIMTQYMVEASVLSIAGGIIGLMFVWLLFMALNTNGVFVMEISFANAINGVAISVVIGLLAGLVPAYQAASADPVRAINS